MRFEVTTIGGLVMLSSNVRVSLILLHTLNRVAVVQLTCLYRYLHKGLDEEYYRTSSLFFFWIRL
jgi:hypothetical protein